MSDQVNPTPQVERLGHIAVPGGFVRAPNSDMALRERADEIRAGLMHAAGNPTDEEIVARDVDDVDDVDDDDDNLEDVDDDDGFGDGFE